VLFEEGSTVLGSATLVAGSSGTSTASFSTSSLSLGNHTLFAVYQGDTDHEASTSGNLTVSVIQTPSSIMTPMVATAGWTPANAAWFQDANITGNITRGTETNAFTAELRVSTPDDNTFLFTENGREMIDVSGYAGVVWVTRDNVTFQPMRLSPGSALSIRG